MGLYCIIILRTKQGAKNTKFNNKFVILNHISASGYVVSLTFQHTQLAVKLKALPQTGTAALCTAWPPYRDITPVFLILCH